MFLAFFLTISIFRAGEGMWLPFLLKALNEAEMKSMGMKMSADDIYSVNHGSLKDAEFTLVVSALVNWYPTRACC